MQGLRRLLVLATFGLELASMTAGADAAGQTGMPALPKPPYTIKCFQDRDLVVVENLAARPVWKDGQWQGRTWSGDPQHPGPEIVVQPGGNGTCIVRQNERG